MRRLGIYACILVILIGVVGGFSTPKKVFALDTTTQEAQNYLASGNDILDKQITALQTEKDSPTQGGDSTPTTVTTLLNWTTTAKELFNTTFSQSSSAPPVAYGQALRAASDYIIQQRNQGGASLRTPYIMRTTASMSKQLTDEASSDLLYNARISGGMSGVDASTLRTDTATTNAAVVQKVIAQTPPNPSACTIGLTPPSFDAPGCISFVVEWIIKNTLLQFAGFLVWISANLLNMVVQIGILNFKSWAPDALYPIWIIVRQIVSLCVVFAGLYLGFMYIIGRQDAFEKYIPWIIIFALFVNFSYPITRALIDVSNVVSLNIYTSAVGNNVLTGDPNNSGGALIMNKIGLQGLIMSAETVSSSATASTGLVSSVSGSIPGALMAVVFVVYAAYIFFMATWILMARTAVLVFLIVASPILFIDSVIPKLGEKAAELRGMYFNQLIVAPVFMIMLALTLKFLDVFRSGPFKATTAGSVASFFNILMMLIMLHIMLKVTKSISGTVGEYATNVMGKVGGFGLGVATGGAGLLARGTLGRGAAALRDSKWVTNNQDSFLGRRAYNLSNSLASSTYDVRNVGMISSGMNKAGMGMGTGGKKSYEETIKERNKDRAERFGRIEQTYKEDVFDKQGNVVHRKGDINEEGKEAAARFSKTGGVLTNRGDLIKNLKVVQGEQNSKEVSGVDKLANEFTQNYNGADKKNKNGVLDNLKQQLEDTKKTDPNLEGERGRALTRAVRNIENAKKKEKDDFKKQAISSFKVYKTMNAEKQKTYLAQQSDDLQNVMGKMIEAEKTEGAKKFIDVNELAETVAEEESSKLFNIPKPNVTPPTANTTGNTTAGSTTPMGPTTSGHTVNPLTPGVNYDLSPAQRAAQNTNNSQPASATPTQNGKVGNEQAPSAATSSQPKFDVTSQDFKAFIDPERVAQIRAEKQKAVANRINGVVTGEAPTPIAETKTFGETVNAEQLNGEAKWKEYQQKRMSPEEIEEEKNRDLPYDDQRRITQHARDNGISYERAKKYLEEYEQMGKEIREREAEREAQEAIKKAKGPSDNTRDDSLSMLPKTPKNISPGTTQNTPNEDIRSTPEYETPRGVLPGIKYSSVSGGTTREGENAELRKALEETKERSPDVSASAQQPSESKNSEAETV